MKRLGLCWIPLALAACLAGDDAGTADDGYVTEADACSDMTCSDARDSVNLLVFAKRVASGTFPYRAELPTPADYEALEVGEMTGFCDVAFRTDPETGTEKRMLFCTNAVRIAGDHAGELERDILRESFAEMVFGGGEAYYEQGFVADDASCSGIRQVFDFYPETIVGDVPAAKLAIALAEPVDHGDGVHEIPARLMPPATAPHDRNPGDGCGTVQETGDLHGDMRLFVSASTTGTGEPSTLFIMNWEGMTVEPLGASNQSISSVANAVRAAFLKWMVGDGHNGAMQHGMTEMWRRYEPSHPITAPTFVSVCDATAFSAWNWSDGGKSLCE